MEMNNKLIKINVINSIIVGLLFIVYYNRCGKTFDYCLPLIEFFVIFGVIALISGFFGSKISEDRKKRLLYGTLSIILAPFIVIILALLLLGFANADISDLFFQFYVIPIGFIGALIGLLISKIKK